MPVPPAAPYPDLPPPLPSGLPGPPGRHEEDEELERSAAYVRAGAGAEAGGAARGDVPEFTESVQEREERRQRDEIRCGGGWGGGSVCMCVCVPA